MLCNEGVYVVQTEMYTQCRHLECLHRYNLVKRRKTTRFDPVQYTSNSQKLRALRVVNKMVERRNGRELAGKTSPSAAFNKLVKHKS